MALYDSEGGRSAEQLLQVNVQSINAPPTFTLNDPTLVGQNLGAQVRIRLSCPVFDLSAPLGIIPSLPSLLLVFGAPPPLCSLFSAHHISSS